MPFDCKYLNLQISSFCSSALSLTVVEILTFEIFDLEKLGQRKEYTIRNDAIRWQMLKFINVTYCSFVLAFTVFEILTFEIFYF